MPTRYDHPNCIVRRESFFNGPAAASGTVGVFTPQQKMRLVAVHAVVGIAGTNVAANTYAIRNGTTSIGSIAPGTNTALSVLHATVNEVIDRGEILNLLKGADATGVTNFTYEYEVLPDALQT